MTMQVNAKKFPAKTLILTTLIAAAVAGGWWWSHNSGAGADGQKDGARKGGGIVAVGVSSVRREDTPVYLDAMGTSVSPNAVTVKSRVDGELRKIHFEEGKPVREGQLLAELDSRPYAASVLQAEGQLQRDQALLKNAQLDLDRYRQLLSENSIARQQVETQEALVQQYQGVVKLDQGALDNAKLQLSYSRIVAPLSGRVGLRQVDQGNIVHASDANGVVTITQTQPINVQFSLPETLLSSLLEASRSSQGKLVVEAWNRDGKKLLAQGQLLAIDNQLNSSTGTVALKAKFANSNEVLFPNQFVNVRLMLGNREQAIVIPTAAIQTGRQGTYVYVVNDDETVTLTKVRPGPVSGEQTIIEDGLKAGQKVVTDGVDKLRDGSKVKVADRAAGQGGGEKRQKREAGSKSATEATSASK